MSDLLKEAIADAKAVRETALANAKMALEEAFTPHLKSMLSAKLAEDEIEEDEEELEEGEEIVREYTEKVAAPKGEDHKADSTVAGKNDMGGTASNIAQGGEEAHGKAPAAKEENAGNKNVPGGSQGLEKA